MKVVKRVNPKSSQHREFFFFFLSSVSIGNDGCGFGAEVNRGRQFGALMLQVGLLASKWPAGLREGSGSPALGG